MRPSYGETLQARPPFAGVRAAPELVPFIPLTSERSAPESCFSSELNSRCNTLARLENRCSSAWNTEAPSEGAVAADAGSPSGDISAPAQRSIAGGCETDSGAEKASVIQGAFAFELTDQGSNDEPEMKLTRLHLLAVCICDVLPALKT